MHREGHVGIGLLLYSPIAYILVKHGSLTIFGLGLIGMAVWSFAPDVDMALPIRHRGPTHTFLAAIVAGVITAMVTVYLIVSGKFPTVNAPVSGGWRTLAVTFFAFCIGFLGVVGHLLGDAMTPMKVRPWWPWSNREHGLGIVEAANEDVNHFLSVAGAVAVSIALILGTGVSIPIPF